MKRNTNAGIKNNPVCSREHKMKIAISLVSGIILFGIYVMIFSFSSQDGDASGEISRGTAYGIVEIIESVFKVDLPWNDSPMEIEAFNNVVRKAAHMLEYAVVGFFWYVILLCWFTDSRMKFPGVGFILLISASLDELHQYFVPGRYSSPKDVCIDVIGGMLGAAFLHMIYLLKLRSQSLPVYTE